MKEDIIISEEEAGQRLDKLLFQRFEGKFSRAYFQDLIERNLILVNTIPVKKRIQPKVGDEVEIEFALTPEIDLIPEPIPLDVLYEDEHLLIVNKPPNMVVHPAPGNWRGTFVNALLYHCHVENLEGENLRPGIVHRLDKDTSGVMIAAKTVEAHSKLVEAFSTRKVIKEYLAICNGVPKKETINAPIGRHPIRRKEMMVIEGAKSAISHIEPLAWNDRWSVVKVRLETGRTHQIRVHLQHIGQPILGDFLYGNKKLNEKLGVKRQLLHAHFLSLTHPMTKKLLEVKVNPPEDMQKWIDRITQ